jgi:FixJ family two-component response regulator
VFLGIAYTAKVYTKGTIMSALVWAGDAATNEKVVVHVIDDDESLRDALNGLLWSVGLETRTYGSVRQFLDARAQDGPGCIVLDVRLPGISGLDFQSQLAGLGIHLPVVLMTGHGDVLMSVRAMKAGAVDFLPKPFRDQDMIDAVSIAIERNRQRRAADGNVARIRDCFATLSSREQQIMMGVTAGKMNKQVAGDLGVSEITVKVHRGVAMRKMCARTLPDLVRMAHALELFSTEQQPVASPSAEGRDNLIRHHSARSGAVQRRNGFGGAR